MKFKYFEDIKKYIIYIGFFFAIYFVFLFDLKPRKKIPYLGEVASFDLVAKNDFIFEDKKETERFRKEEMERIPKQYWRDKTVALRIDNKLDDIFKLIYQKNEKKLVEKYGLTKKDLINLWETDYRKLLEYRNSLSIIFQRALKIGIKDDDTISDFIRGIKNNKIIRNFSVKNIIKKVFEPNLKYDKKRTENLKKEVAYKILPIYIKIKKGDILLRKGEIVDEHKFEILKAMGFYKSSNVTLIQKIGIFIFVSIIAVIGYFYLKFFGEELLKVKQAIYLILVLIMLNIFMVKFYKVIIDANINIENILGKINVLSPALFPLATTSLIVTILVDPKLSLMLGAFLATLLIYQLNINYYYIYYFLFQSCFSVYLGLKENKLSSLTKKGFLLGIINSIVILSLYLIFEDPLYFNKSYWLYIGRDMFWGFISGIFSVILTIGLLPYFESTFRLSSSISLLELSDLNQPLLRELMMKAPGTYQHSIVVGNLAEAAARTVDANPILAKIGGYYHDIGKVKRPYFFSENQLGENKHDELKPHMSALIIISHVKDGVELAKKNNIPDEIVDIIAQHHGNSLLQYFYSAAKKAAGNEEEVDIEQFKYPGPLPQTREAAVVMLADSVESATRSLDNHSVTNIEAVVKKIINDRFVEEQLNECDITLKDLEKIAKIFIKMLIGMHHSRIKYPEQDKELFGMMEHLNEVRNSK